MRHLAVADEAAVHPHVETGIHALKIQECPRCFLLFFPLERSHVRTARVLIRHIRRIHRERVADIRILMVVMAIILPDGRHRNRLECRSVVSFCEKLLFYIVNTGKIAEFPVAGKQEKAVRRLPVLHQILHAAGCRNVVGTVRHGIHMQVIEIFEIFWNNHLFIKSSLFCLLFPISAPKHTRSRCRSDFLLFFYFFHAGRTPS